MKKILVVNVNWLGDVIFSVPAFRALKSYYPQAKVCCLAVPRVKEVLASCPFIDEIIVYDEKGRDRGLGAKVRLVRRLRAEKFDIVFLFHRSWTRALLVFLAGIPERVGFNTKGRGIFLTTRLALPPRNTHRSDFYMRVLEGYGLIVSDNTCRLRVDPAGVAAVNRRLTDNGVSAEDFVAVMHVGGNWALKRWPKENFSELVKRFVKEGVRVVLSGGPGDRELAQEIVRLSGAEALVLAGQTDFYELLALMRYANLVISADSGPLHVASAVGATGIGIFGPTRPEITGPRGPGKITVLQQDVHCNREPCYNVACADNVCMKAVTVDEVWATAARILAQKQRVSR